MPDYPPFMNAYGNLARIMSKIKEAKTPERFTVDFLNNTLGFKGGSATPFIPFAKRIGLLASDGTPTDLYSRLNPNESGPAMAEAMRKGYAVLYERNENAHNLDRRQLEGLIVEATGLEKGSPTLRAIAASFEALNTLAKFDSAPKPPATIGAKLEENGQEQHGANLGNAEVGSLVHHLYQFAENR
jgi:hypothetical protein